MAGQVFSGTCGCLGGESETRHSCCKRQKTAGDSISKKGCCSTNCMVRQSEKPVQESTGLVAKIKCQAADEPVTMPRILFQRVAASATVRIQPLLANHRPKSSRRLDLYLRHHAFLI